MESEKIKIYTEDCRYLGIARRDEIHKQGYWHQTFHCWFISRRCGKDWIHLQMRSSAKKDFPALLDVTAAGHLLADENVEDGVREVEEELGITVEFKDLISLGTIKDQIHQNGFFDNELCQVFLFLLENGNGAAYKLQKEEVAGIVAVEFEEFYKLCFGQTTEIEVMGFEIWADSTSHEVKRKINLQDIVPHSRQYLQRVAVSIAKELALR